MGSEENTRGLSQPAKEFGTALLVLLVLIPFSTRISEIYVDPSDPGFGSRDFPRLIVWFGIGLSVILAGKALMKLQIRAPKPRQLLPVLSGPVLLFLVAGAYIYGVQLFQYLLPTFALLIFLTMFFGNTGWKRTILTPLFAVCIYYFVFFILFGIFEERGTILSYDSYGFARSIRSFIGLN
ncbi:MAG: tripartite tricarboxylate transporter TctB family protein [Rhodobacteraceae bacterium]|nr:tripartite tricarboxylate transporter TctB family protein [Paracoccaceae bacterium]